MTEPSENYPHSYQPLFDTLEKFGYTMKDLQKKTGVADKTILKLTWGEPVMVSVLCKIALILGVELTDIVALNYSWEPDIPKHKKLV